MKPPIGRKGGKSKLASKLIEMFPEHKIYVEPFLGAGNIYFRKDPSDIEIINDLDPVIYKIMKALKTRGKYINDHIKRDITQDYFNSIKNKHDVLSELIKIKTSFYDQGKNYSSSRDGSSINKIKTDFSLYKDRMKNTTILNKSFEFIINKYDSLKTFFYLDPPYESVTQTDYKDYVDPQDVFNALQGIKGKFMLSYNDSPNIRKIFRKYNIIQIKTKYIDPKGGIDRKEKIELVITNYIPRGYP